MCHRLCCRRGAGHALGATLPCAPKPQQLPEERDSLHEGPSPDRRSVRGSGLGAQTAAYAPQSPEESGKYEPLRRASSLIAPPQPLARHRRVCRCYRCRCASWARRPCGRPRRCCPRSTSPAGATCRSIPAAPGRLMSQHSCGSRPTEGRPDIRLCICSRRPFASPKHRQGLRGIAQGRTGSHADRSGCWRRPGLLRAEHG